LEYLEDKWIGTEVQFDDVIIGKVISIYLEDGMLIGTVQFYDEGYSIKDVDILRSYEDGISYFKGE